MKILFVYPGYIVREVPLNILYLSSAVKKEGHQTDLFHFKPYGKTCWFQTISEKIEKGFIERLERFNPDLIAFSVMVQDYAITLNLTEIAKFEYKIPLIWRGIQPIIEPAVSIRVLTIYGTSPFLN